ncbi:MAG: hypothetical protein JWO44_414 [Bacteroidetes bacterium]|nr:hypothetical protein [Bacteroidota bacterium]
MKDITLAIKNSILRRFQNDALPKGFNQKAHAVITNLLKTLTSLGLVLLVIYGFRFDGTHLIIKVITTSLFLGFAYLMIGGVLGFLFGIPKTLQKESKAGDDQQSTSFNANTNLEQISDWLTKIIVGVGLTQLYTIPHKIYRLGEIFAPYLGGEPPATDAKIFGIVLFLFFVPVGFIYGYIYTRMYLPNMLADADRMLREVGEIYDAKSMGAYKALNKLDILFNPSINETSLDTRNLIELIKNSPPLAKNMIFEKTRDFRRKCKENGHLKDMMRTIPVFQALIDDENQENLYQQQAQLAYIYKDIRPILKTEEDKKQNLMKAIKLFGEAIVNRKVDGFFIYEYNRAYCNILLDDNYRENKATSDASLKNAITADLRLIKAKTGLQTMEQNTGEARVINKWIALNPGAIS